MGSTQISRSAKGRKVTAKAVRNTAAKAVKTATAVANGKKGKKGMKNPSAMTKGLKVAKQQPKKEAASKVLAKKEAARSLAMIDSLPEMRKCVIDECFWDSEARNQLADDAAVKFAYAVSQKCNGNPEPFREVCENGAEKPVVEALDHLQDVHKVRLYCYKKAKVFARKLITEYSERPDSFKVSESDAENKCEGLKQNQIFWCLPETLRNRMEGLVAKENPYADSYNEQELAKALKESLLAEELFDVVSESVEYEVHSLIMAYDEYDADCEEVDETVR